MSKGPEGTSQSSSKVPDGAPLVPSWVDTSEIPRSLIKSTMKRKSLTYEDLARLLNENGIEESGINLKTKINRGNFSAAFFLGLLNALKVNLIQLDSEWHLTANNEK